VTTINNQKGNIMQAGVFYLDINDLIATQSGKHGLPIIPVPTEDNPNRVLLMLDHVSRFAVEVRVNDIHDIVTYANMLISSVENVLRSDDD